MGSRQNSKVEKALKKLKSKTFRNSTFVESLILKIVCRALFCFERLTKAGIKS